MEDYVLKNLVLVEAEIVFVGVALFTFAGIVAKFKITNFNLVNYFAHLAEKSLIAIGSFAIGTFIFWAVMS